jgi:predicted transcriptional regulator of viral defense system
MARLRDIAPARPDWGRLFETAEAQAGHFTTAQAAAAGYSSQLLQKHLRSGRITRVRRGVYRLVHFPPGDREDLVVVWLWSDRCGVFSHETALRLHDLGDARSPTLHLTLPLAWRRRRLRVPDGVVLHHADVPGSERTTVGAVPVTTPARTLADCVGAGVRAEVLQRALVAGLARGVVDAPLPDSWRWESPPRD